MRVSTTLFHRTVELDLRRGTTHAAMIEAGRFVDVPEHVADHLTPERTTQHRRIEIGFVFLADSGEGDDKTVGTMTFLDMLRQNCGGFMPAATEELLAYVAYDPSGAYLPDWCRILVAPHAEVRHYAAHFPDGELVEEVTDGFLYCQFGADGNQLKVHERKDRVGTQAQAMLVFRELS